MTKELPVVVMAYNEAPYIGETLNSLEDCGFDEVFILDNGSSDGTAKMIADLESNPIFNIYLRDTQGEINDNLAFLASEVGARHFYLLGADDFIKAKAPSRSICEKEHSYSYILPDTHYFKDGEGISCATYPDEYWFSSLLLSTRKSDIVRIQLLFASVDAHFLGLHYAPFLKKLILDLNHNSIEGSAFWLVLCNLLMANKKCASIVSREPSFVLHKRIKNKFKTGTSAKGSNHNQHIDGVYRKIFRYISHTWGSLYNSFYVIIVFRLNFLASAYLLFGARRNGKDAKIFALGPFLNVFLSITKQIRRLLFQRLREKSRE